MVMSCFQHAIACFKQGSRGSKAWWLLAGALWMASMPAQADEATPEAKPAASNWDVHLSLGAFVFPEYRGSRDYRALPLPMVGATWNNRLWLNPIGGARWSLTPDKALSVGPVVKYVRGRRNRGELSNLSRASGGFAGGVFAHYRLGPVQLEGEVIHALSGGLEGSQAQLQAHLHGRLSPRLHYSTGPAVKWASSRWNDAYFGISATDAERSGLPAYTPGAGLTELQLHGRLSYILDRQSAISVFGSVGRLLEDAADSPIVSEVGRPQQVYFGLMWSRKL